MNFKALLCIVGSVTLFALSSCGNETKSSADTKSATPKTSNSPKSTTFINSGSASFTVLDLEEYQAKLANEKRDHYLVDVRTAKELKDDGQIPGAVNIDYLKANFKEKASELDSSKPVYIYCRSGNRSRMASDTLAVLGFKEVYDLKGGYKAYAAAQ